MYGFYMVGILLPTIVCLANDNYINGTDKTYKKWSVDANCNLRVEVLLKAESIFAVLLVSHYSLYGSLLECLCGSYLCYCHYLMPHCPLGVLSTRVYICQCDLSTKNLVSNETTLRSNNT